MKKAGHQVQHICRCLTISASTFYYRAKPKRIDSEKVQLEAAMKHIHNEMDATYGKRRMLSELLDMVFSLGNERVRRWMPPVSG